MEMVRFELMTPCLQGRCSPNWATPPFFYLYTQRVVRFFLQILVLPVNLYHEMLSHFRLILSGSHLLFHAVSNIVSSAVLVLTVVFGMCTGVSPERIATRNFFSYP